MKPFVIIIIFFFFNEDLLFSQPQTEWIRQFNSGGSNQDYVNDMKLDKQGNIYMCGYVRYDAQNSDVLLLKYNSNGVLQWSRTFNGRATFSNDVAKKIIIDDSGYVYVMGKVQFNTITDYLIMKYDQNGDTLWVRSFDGGNGEVDDPTDMALDSNYNIYITGIIYRKGNSDIGTLKYDKDGNLKWVRINFYGSPGNILTDSGNVYVNCGLYADTANRKNISILKYDKFGKLLDTINYRVSASVGEKMVFDLNNNFILSGAFDAGISTRIDLITAKISYIGIGKWSSIFNNNFDNSSEVFRDLKLDNNNNIYLLARCRNLQYQRAEYALVKYNNLTGDSIWTRKYTSVPYANDDPSEMSIDNYGNIYITGSSDFNLLYNRFVTLKYNPQGVLQWHTEYTPSVFVNSEGLRILNDTLGSLYVSGITKSSATGDDIVLIKYSHLTKIELVNNNTPDKYELYQNYPNPFNSQTRIEFVIAKNNKYKLEIFDVLGRIIDVVLDEFKNAGRYSMNFNASDLTSGIYYYKLSSSEISLIKKICLIK